MSSPGPSSGGPARPPQVGPSAGGTELQVIALALQCFWAGARPGPCDPTVQKHSELKRGVAGLFLFVLEGGWNENWS